MNTKNLYVKTDPELDFYAIIALQDNKTGPAIGGCRCIEYVSTEEAVYDALRLAQMMSHKATLANLDHGGAKAVLIKPKQIKNRQAYFAKFADFVNELGGRYITAVDSGTSPADMDIIRQHTAHVVCTTTQEKMGGGASAFTALSVRRAIEAAVKFKLGKDNLTGVHIAIQGAGNVSYYLAKQLTALGARITVCDINPEKTQAIVQECDRSLSNVDVADSKQRDLSAQNSNVYPLHKDLNTKSTQPSTAKVDADKPSNIQVVSPEKIYSLECDVFAPCALGGVLNAVTIPTIQASIIVGAANNQLATPSDGLLLHHRNILYAPDFVVNAGGLIYAAAMYNQETEEDKIRRDTEAIYDTILSIFTKAQQEGQATSEVAEKMAKANLAFTISAESALSHTDL